MEYEDLNRIVFDSDSGLRASIGEIAADAHWASVIQRLKRPATEISLIREEFFAGDIVDRTLVEYIRSLRGKYKTGLISNAWSDLRDFVVREKFDDAFDQMIISAEVGAVKPEPKIFQLALQQFGVKPREAVFVDDDFPPPVAPKATGVIVKSMIATKLQCFMGVNPPAK